MRTALGWLILLLALSGDASLAAPAAASADLAGKPGAIAVAPAGVTYHAQAGDTLLSIALRFTARRDTWPALGKLNHIEKDSRIPVGAAILIPAELLADEPVEAKVAALSGDVTARSPDGTPVPLAVGSRVAEGMEIDTGGNSFLTIALPDASRIALPSKSRVKLAKLRMTRYTRSPRTELLLLHGQVESRVTPLEASGGRFQVRTRHSVAGVRGTHFRVRLMGSTVASEVLSGRVAVGTESGDEQRLLASGTGNLIDTQSVGIAVNLLPAPQVVPPAGQQVYPAALFTLVPVAGAATYHVQVSTDRDAQDIIAEQYASDIKMRIDGLPDGDYFLHASAITGSGLEGLPRTAAFTLRTRAQASASSASAPAAPYVSDSDRKTVTLRWAASDGQKFNLQVARDMDFSWLVSSVSSDRPMARIARPPFGTYYARVQAVTTEGVVTAFSAAQPIIVTDQWVINDGNPIKATAAPSSVAR